jgi:hypothetical protein
MVDGRIPGLNYFNLWMIEPENGFLWQNLDNSASLCDNKFAGTASARLV